MGIKSAFLNVLIQEKVYVEHPLGLKWILFLILFSNLTKLYMDLYTLLELGMKNLVPL